MWSALCSADDAVQPTFTHLPHNVDLLCTYVHILDQEWFYVHIWIIDEGPIALVESATYRDTGVFDLCNKTGIGMLVNSDIWKMHTGGSSKEQAASGAFPWLATNLSSLRSMIGADHVRESWESSRRCSNFQSGSQRWVPSTATGPMTGIQWLCDEGHFDGFATFIFTYESNIQRIDPQDPPMNAPAI